MASRKRGFAMGNRGNAMDVGGAWLETGRMGDLGAGNGASNHGASQHGASNHGASTHKEGKAGKAPPAKAGDPNAAQEQDGAAAEHLSRDFARVRARLAVDPAFAGRSLAAAWTTDVMEEDEAEFVDTVADCMGAGLSLETALTGWDLGALATEPIQDTVAADEEDPSESYVSIALGHQQAPGARRVFVR